MEHGEAWLLETLAIFRLPVGSMKRAQRQMAEWLNRGYHGLSYDDLVNVLADMFTRGDIDAFYDDEMLKPAGLSDFLAALEDRHSPMHCGVTRAGGERWEVLAKPDWCRYFDLALKDEEYVEITAGSQERLTELASNAEILFRWTMSIDKDSINQITPWQPLAWKILPVGYTATVRYVKIPFVARSREEFDEEWRRIRPRYIELSSWATSICGQSYV